MRSSAARGNIIQADSDCADNAEAGGITISEAQTLTTNYVKLLSTENVHNDCRRWKERNPQDQTWNSFNIHFTTAYRQHKQMKGEAAAASGYANAAVSQPADDDLSEAAIYDLVNLATATAVDRDIVTTMND
jgi:hypothetical protein